MGKHNGLRRLMFLLIVVASSAALNADSDIQVSSVVDWANYRVEVELSADIDPDNPNRATALSSLERRIDRFAPAALTAAIQDLRVDSRSYLADHLRRDPHLVGSPEQIRSVLQRGFSQPTANLRGTTIRYSLDLVRFVIDPLIMHRMPRELDVGLAWAPQGTFSGLVVYAAEPLPVWGETTAATMHSSLFPRLFAVDERDGMSVLLERDMVDPQYLRSWGVAGYVDHFNESAHVDRIGTNPLRIAARFVFGVNRTDLVVAGDDARMLLLSAAGRQILREGRVLIIVETGRTVEHMTQRLAFPTALNNSQR